MERVPCADDSLRRKDDIGRLERQAAPHRLQTERARAHVRVAHARTVVLYRAHHRPVRLARYPNEDLAGSVDALKGPVFYCVLHERLQEEARQELPLTAVRSPRPTRSAGHRGGESPGICA